MGKGRKATIPEQKDNSTYKDIGAIRQQQDIAPKGYPDTLPVPKDLNDGAKKEWRRIIRLFRQGDTKIINNLDLYMLKAYCIEVDIYDRLYKQWQNEGCEIIKSSSTDTAHQKLSPNNAVIEQSVGNTRKKVINPLLDALQKHSNTIRVYAEQLGLTPVGRAGWTVRTAKKERDALDDFMGDE